MGRGAGGRCSAAPTIAIIAAIVEHSPGYVENFIAPITKLAQRLSKDHFLLIGAGRGAAASGSTGLVIGSSNPTSDASHPSTMKLCATPTMAVVDEVLAGSPPVDTTPDEAMLTLISCIRLLGKQEAADVVIMMPLLQPPLPLLPLLLFVLLTTLSWYVKWYYRSGSFTE